MLYVNSGNGRVPLISLIALLSISLTVNLPGLAISPILGKLSQVFPHSTALEEQLLTVLPNLVIIPFILGAGKICTQRNQMWVLGIGLGLYTLTGVLYFFASTMIELILLSCLLGVGCGLVVPLAASLISLHFTGSARQKQLGMKSGLSNASVIVGTVFVGWVAAFGWHLSFIIYMVPIIPLVLIPFMTNKYIEAHRIPRHEPGTCAVPEPHAPKPKDEKVAMPDVHGEAPKQSEMHRRGQDAKRAHLTVRQSLLMLLGFIGIYFTATYATQVVSYDLPYTFQHYGLSDSSLGVATAMFYLSASLSGLLLPYLMRLLGRTTMYVAIALCVIGLYGAGFFHDMAAYCIFIFVMGVGYGIIQPVLYDKTTQVAPDPKHATKYFSYLLAGNYIAIASVPFIVDGLADLFGDHGTNFSYFLNGSFMAALLVVAFLCYRSFAFRIRRRSDLA